MKKVNLFNRILGRLGLGGIVGFIMFAVWFGGTLLSPEQLVWWAGSLFLVMILIPLLIAIILDKTRPAGSDTLISDSASSFQGVLLLELQMIAVGFVISKIFGINWLEGIGFPANLSEIDYSWIIHLFMGMFYWLIFLVLIALIIRCEVVRKGKHETMLTFVFLTACVAAFVLARIYLI